MHNLAIALHLKGDEVTGSDDEIFEPSKSRLDKYGLLPASIGWNPDLINKNIYPKNKEDLKVEDDNQSSALGSMGLKPKIVH